jgi:hypothetical protein
MNLLETSRKVGLSKGAVRSKIDRSWAGYGSKVLLSNKQGLCQMNRKLAQRIDDSSNRAFAGHGDRELLPFWNELNFMTVLPCKAWGH